MPAVEVATKHRVEAFHINCGPGDSTILCWLKPSPQPKDNKFFVLHKCVIIDGGLPASHNGKKAGFLGTSTTHLTIANALTNLFPSLYELPSNENRAYVDALVITHWDSDHYGGIIEFLKTDLATQYDTANKGKPNQRISVNKFSFVRYTQDNKTEATIYVPYLSGSSSKDVHDKDKDKDFKPRDPGNSLTLDNVTTAIDQKIKFENVKINVRHGARNLIGFNLFQNERPSSLQPTAAVNHYQRTWSKEVPAPSFLVAAHDTSQGTSNEQGDGFKGLKENEPGLFIIRTHRFGFYDPTAEGVTNAGTIASNTYTNVTRTESYDEIAKKAKNGAGPVNLNIIDPSHLTLPANVTGLPMIVPANINLTDSSLATNSASVICILAWQGAKTDGSVRISHYLGGDATWDQEKLASQWLVKVPKNPNAKPQDENFKDVKDSEDLEVSCLKLSHHGANNSTPFELFDNLRPRYVVVSAGNAYGHPRAHVVLWIRAWLRKINSQPRSAADKTKRFKPRDHDFFFPTRFPFYLVLIWTKGGYIRNYAAFGSITALIDPPTRGPIIAYLNSLRKQWDQAQQFNGANPPVPCPIDTWQREAENTRVLDDRDKLDEAEDRFIQLTEEAFNEISSFPPNANRPTIPALNFNLVQTDDYDYVRLSFAKDGCEKPRREFASAASKPRSDIVDQMTEALEANPAQAPPQAGEQIPAALNRPEQRTPQTPTPDVRVTPGSQARLTGQKIRNISSRRSKMKPKPEDDFDSDVEDDWSDDDGISGNQGTSGTPIKGGGGTNRRVNMMVVALAPAPSNNTKMRTEPEVRDQTAALYVIASTGCPFQLKMPHERLTLANPLNDFVDRLNYRSLVFKWLYNSDRYATSLELHHDDDLLNWIRIAVGADRLQLIREEDKDHSNTKATWKALSISIPANKLSIHADAASLIEFSTDYLEDTFLTSPGEASLHPGYLASWGTLVLGAKCGDSSLEFALGDLLVYFGLYDARSPIMTLGMNLIMLKFTPRKGDAGRNALWINPSRTYKTDMRLEFDLVAADSLNNILPFSIIIENAKVVMKKKVTRFDDFANAKLIPMVRSEIWFKLTLEQKAKDDAHGKGPSIDTMIGLSQDSFSLDLRPVGYWGGVRKWMVEIFSDSSSQSTDENQDTINNDIEKALGQVCHDLKQVSLHSARVTGTPANKKANIKGGITSFEISILVPVNVGSGWTDTDLDDNDGDRDEAKSCKSAFLITVLYDKSATSNYSLTGELYSPILRDPSSNFPDEYWPQWEGFGKPIDDQTKYSSKLNLRTLLPGSDTIAHLPYSLKASVTEVSIRFERESVSFGGMIVCNPDLPATSTTNVAADTPSSAISFGNVELYASYSWAAPKPSTSLHLSAQVKLDSLTEPESTASISASLTYIDKVWRLMANIRCPRLDFLSSFFQPQHRKQVARLAGHLMLSELDLQYEYDNTAQDSSFAFSGLLTLDDLDLGLRFTRTVEQGKVVDWAFNASAAIRQNESKPAMTLNRLLFAITNDATVSVPPFADIIIEGGIGLKLVKGQRDDVVLVLQARIDGFVADFVQITERRKAGNTVAGDETSQPLVKRCLVLTIDKLPWDMVPHIPMVGKITQPFDKLQYVFVHGAEGLNKLETDEINNVEDFPGITPEPSKQDVPTDANAIVLEAGSHFVVSDSNGGQVRTLLNYRFGGVPKTDTSTDVPKPDGGDTGGGDTGEDDEGSASGTNTRPKLPRVEPNDPPAKTKLAKLNKSEGPLSIANFGLRYISSKDSGILHIILDATVALGPLEFALKGLEVVFKFSDGKSLNSIASSDIELHLTGLAIAFDKPPVVIAGMFQNNTPTSPGPDDRIITNYSGGAVLGIEPYAFVAAGSYGELKTDDKLRTFKSVFIFAELAGPLVELEFGEINDITAGFGFNSVLRLPSVSDVKSFPFVSNVFGSGDQQPSDPLELLGGLTDSRKPGGWITQKEGPLWMAAGLGVSAFQVLNVKAVVVLEFNPYASLSIFADATLSMPSSGPGRPPNRTKAFLFAELGIASSVNFHEGTMQLEARLMPQSFILDPSCHLSGGFAMSYWFGTNSHAGDWVITVGGYHPAYNRPSHYPSVDRVAISWNLDGGVNVHGQAYFAITPKMCMGGGLLQATLDAGPLSAYFDAHADFLVLYQPFHFTAKIGIEVGVRFTMDLCFVTAHISADVSATLDLWGPPVGGKVYVDFYIHSFSIPIGRPEAPPEAVGLSQFWALLLQEPGEPQPRTTLAKISAEGHTLSVKDGLQSKSGQAGASTLKSSQGAPWRIRMMGATLTVQTKCAISMVQMKYHTVTERIDSQTTVYAKPMQLSGNRSLQSLMSISISMVSPAGNTLIDGWKMMPVYKLVPRAVWGECKYQGRNQVCFSLQRHVLTFLLHSCSSLQNPKTTHKSTETLATC